MRLRNICSNIFGYFACFPFPFFFQKIINKIYVNMFSVDLSEHEPIHYYPTLNALFTRSLVKRRDYNKAHNVLIAPCDSKVIAQGIASNDRAMQIKGKTYQVSKLLGEKIEKKMNFINFYLSPQDYHRFHAPTDLYMHSIRYFSGYLYSVRESVLQSTDNIFAHNERVVIKAFDNYGNSIFFVAVGAMNVGKIIIYKEPKIHTNSKKPDIIYQYKEPILIKKGEEMGYFKMGSSIILFVDNCLIHENINKIRFGEDIGTFYTKELNDE